MNAEPDQKAEAAGQNKPPSRLREGLIVGAALAVGGLLLFGIYIYWNFERDHPATDNAYVNANYVWISPRVDGEIAEVFVADNQLVKEGEKLFALDSSLYDAELSAAEAALVLVHQDIEAGKARVAAAKAQVAEQRAFVATAEQLSKATKPLVRDGVEPVLKGVEVENSLAEAKSKLDTLLADLTVAEKEYGTPESRPRSSRPKRPSRRRSSTNSGRPLSRRPTATLPTWRCARAMSSAPAISCFRSSKPARGGSTPISRRPMSTGSGPDSR